MDGAFARGSVVKINGDRNVAYLNRNDAKGKRGKRDVREFQYRLADNLLALHAELKEDTYRHGGYYAFNISDPKPRNIHKALVRDRLLHHALYRQLYPFFDAKKLGQALRKRLV